MRLHSGVFYAAGMDTQNFSSHKEKEEEREEEEKERKEEERAKGEWED